MKVKLLCALATRHAQYKAHDVVELSDGEAITRIRNGEAVVADADAKVTGSEFADINGRVLSEDVTPAKPAIAAKQTRSANRHRN